MPGRPLPSDSWPGFWNGAVTPVTPASFEERRHAWTLDGADDGTAERAPGREAPARWQQMKEAAHVRLQDHAMAGVRLVGGAVVAVAMLALMPTDAFAALGADQRWAHAAALTCALATVSLAGLARTRRPVGHAHAAGSALWALAWAAGIWLALDVAVGDAAAVLGAAPFLALGALAVLGTSAAG